MRPETRERRKKANKLLKLVIEMENKEAKTLVNFFEAVGKLKKIKRTGWLNNGVSRQESESVSDHCLRVSAMALFLGKKLGCNQEKLVKMALLHDLHESACGDLTLDYTKYGSSPGFTPEEKDRLELEGMEKFFAILDASGKQESKEFRELWLEAEEKKTLEARILHELDKLELLLQASEYHRQGKGRKDLFPLFDKVNNESVKTPLLRGILSEIEARTP